MEVHLAACPAHFFIPFFRALHALGKIRGMAGDLRSHYPFVYIIQIRQTQMLRRSDVAKEVCPACCRQRPPDRRSDVIIARCHIGDDRSQDIERRLVSELLCDLHIHADIRDRHMPRAFHHDLHPRLARTHDQLTQIDQLRDLHGICRVMPAAAAASIAQRQCDIILLQKQQQTVKLFVERILLPVHVHPRKEHRAAARDQICDALISHDVLRRLTVQPRMDRHEIHAILRMTFHDREEIICRHILQPLVKDALHIIHRHRTDGRRTVFHQPFTERRRLPIAGQIHDGLRPHLPGELRLRLLCVIVTYIRRDPQIYIHLRPKPLADRIRMERCMVNIRRKDDRPLRDAGADEFCAHALFTCGCFHFLRDDAFSCCFKLRHSQPPIKKSASGGYSVKIEPASLRRYDPIQVQRVSASRLSAP